MKTLLIVEDEKLIRLGIKTMVSRATTPVETIYECKNGEEALEILKKENIEVMLTDIRMPKMDGIELVKEAQKLSHVPIIVIISGFDDFNYAVEVMRYGVKEYLVKPIERDRMNELLAKLEQELQEKYQKTYMNNQVLIQQLKYLLLNPNHSQDERKVLEHQYGEHLNASYVVGCINGITVTEEFQSQPVVLLQNMEGQDVFIYYGRDLDEFCNSSLGNRYYGISKRLTGVDSLRRGYEQAGLARKDSFVRCVSHCIFSDADIEYEEIPGDAMEKFVQLCGSNRQEEAFTIMEKLITKAKQGFLEPVAFISAMQDMVQSLFHTYSQITMQDEQDSIHRFFHVLDYDTIDQFYHDLKPWLLRMNERIQSEYNDYRNKEKVNQAIRYIKENYSKDLNMAVVSNYISMNYSLFSLAFKQYTGVNFVNYLKDIRINEAKRLLRETDDRIIEISHKVGYENEKHFMKTFKALCGVSPSEYRKNNRIGRRPVNESD